MANLPETAQWEAGITQLETSDPVLGGPGGKANEQAEQLGNRTAWLKQQVEGLDNNALDAIWGGLMMVAGDLGLLVRTMDLVRQGMHQEGEITLFNRGVKAGCDLSKSGTATRNLNIAQGVAFAHGREWFVPQEDNAASVPSNTSGQAQTVQAFLSEGAETLELAVTAIGQAVPADGLVLADLLIPDGNTDITDPFLANVTITTVARQEPEWPALQSSPPTETIALAAALAAADYSVGLDLVAFEGGEAPGLLAPSPARSTTAFDVMLIGAADTVTVRWTTHRMGA